MAAERMEVRLTGSPLAARRLRHEVVSLLAGHDHKLSDFTRERWRLVHQVHQRCRFTSGTLYCVRPRCGNPHHRGPHPSPANVHPAHQ
jgi:hypothetical protein